MYYLHKHILYIYIHFVCVETFKNINVETYILLPSSVCVNVCCVMCVVCCVCLLCGVCLLCVVWCVSVV
jgi:hypothetical protein